MAIITVQDVRIEDVKKGKNSYQKMVVVHTNSKNENKEKSIMSFSNPAVFAVFKDAVSGQQYEVTYAKDDPYYNWASAKLTSADAPQPTAPRNGTYIPAADPRETKEERAKRQLMIVRQSSISNALEFAKIRGLTDFSIEDVIASAQEFVDFVYMEPEVGLGTLPTED